LTFVGSTALRKYCHNYHDVLKHTCQNSPWWQKLWAL